MSLLDSNMQIISPLWNILNILTVHTFTWKKIDTSFCNPLWSHPSCFHFLFSQCTHLKPWTSAATESKRLIKRQWHLFYYVLRYRLCIVHMGATGIVSSRHPVGWAVIIHDFMHLSATAKEGHSAKLLFIARVIFAVYLQARCLQYRIILLNVHYLKNIFKATYPCQKLLLLSFSCVFFFLLSGTASKETVMKPLLKYTTKKIWHCHWHYLFWQQPNYASVCIYL